MNLLNGLQNLVSVQVKTNEKLSGHTSFHIGGPARYFLTIRNVDELARVIRFLKRNRIYFFVLGGGTNLLVTDAGIDGAVLKLDGDFKKTEIRGTTLIAGSAARLAVLLGNAARKGLEGLEFCSGIPGTAGGAVLTNAGTELGSMSDVIEEAEIMDGSGRPVKLSKKQLRLSYRGSHVPRGSVITAVRMKLRKGRKSDIMKKIGYLTEKRKKIQPKQSFSAGSVFKNPSPRISAGYLIEKAGLKGRRIGGAVVSRTHANFIVNSRDASATDVIALIDFVRKEVKRQCGISLELELRVEGRV